MSDIAQTSANPGSGSIVVHVDATYEPLVPRFMSNRKKEITAMTDAVAQGDFETVKNVAHGMKGVSGSYGFPEMSSVAARLEQAAETADAGSIRRDLLALASYLDQVVIVYG